jgi:hypothetical protein
MVNFGFNSASLLGIFLAVAGAGLYFMRTLRPELSRDHDIFFAAVGLLSGFILIFQGWRLDPILQFSQLLLAGTAIFFAAETIRLRGFTTEQARRNSPIVDDERPPSRVYRAELAKIDPYEEDDEDYENPRLQGSRDRNNSRRNTYEDEQSRRRRPKRTASRYTDEPPNRSSRSSNTSRNRNDDWEETPDHWEEEKPTPARNRTRDSRVDYTDKSISEPPRNSKKRRPKSAEEIASSLGTEYVDYQPIEDIEDEDIKPRNPESKPEKPLEKPRKPNNAPNFDY